MVRIWERHQRLGDGSEFAPILPLVLYHGRTRWTFDNRFDALFRGPEALRAYWPRFDFEVTDLSRYSDEELQGEVLLRATLLLMKHIFDPELQERLPRMFELLGALRRQQSGVEYLYTFVRYVMSAGERVSVAELRRLVVSMEPEGEGIMATIAQELIEQGIEQGRAEGLAQGLEQEMVQGLAQGIRRGIVLVLQGKFELSDAERERVMTRLAAITDTEQLEALNLHALQTRSIDDFLTHLEQS